MHVSQLVTHPVTHATASAQIEAATWVDEQSNCLDSHTREFRSSKEDVLHLYQQNWLSAVERQRAIDEIYQQKQLDAARSHVPQSIAKPAATG